jgi:hypothetical protein
VSRDITSRYELVSCGIRGHAFCAVPKRFGQISRPELIAFQSGDLELKGFIWKPSGDGPFRAVLWNHASEKNPGTVESVATYFVEKGYVFFVLHRRGQGRSPGSYIMDEPNKAGSRGERGQLLVNLHETHLDDQMAGLKYRGPPKHGTALQVCARRSPKLRETRRCRSSVLQAEMTTI